MKIGQRGEKLHTEKSSGQHLTSEFKVKNGLSLYVSHIGHHPETLIKRERILQIVREKGPISSFGIEMELSPDWNHRHGKTIRNHLNALKAQKLVIRKLDPNRGPWIATRRKKDA